MFSKRNWNALDADLVKNSAEEILNNKILYTRHSKNDWFSFSKDLLSNLTGSYNWNFNQTWKPVIQASNSTIHVDNRLHFPGETKTSTHFYDIFDGHHVMDIVHWTNDMENFQIGAWYDWFYQNSTNTSIFPRFCLITHFM